MKFSAITGCFYPDDIDYAEGVIPADAITVSEVEFAAAMARDAGEILAIRNGQLSILPQPEPSLADMKAAMRRQVQQTRDTHIDAGCVVTGIGKFDTDLQSRVNISGAVTGAMLAQSANQPFTIQWKLADNSVATLTGGQMITAGVTVLGHVSACHAVSQAHIAAIDAAASKSALRALDIASGWPGGTP